MMIWLIHSEKFISSLALNSANAHNFPYDIQEYKNSSSPQSCLLLSLIFNSFPLF